MTDPGMPDGYAQCISCNRELPQTDQYFDIDNDKASGFKSKCKECRAHDRMAAETAEARKVMGRLDKLAVDLIDRASNKNVINVPHVATMLEEMMGVFGGAEGFARHYMANYLSTRPGSQMRAKMLDGVLRMVVETTRSGSADLPLDRLEDGEVDRVVDSIERRLMKKISLHKPDDDGTEPQPRPDRPEATSA